MEIGGGPPPPIPPDIVAFKRLVDSYEKRKGSPNVHQFVKKAYNIPSVEFPAERPCRTALNLAERGLIGQFLGLWSSPKVVDGWVQRNWMPLVTKGI